MPYADPDAQRKARRESAARTRASSRSAVPAEPAVEPVVEPAVAPTWDELKIAAHILFVGPREWGETLDAYRERIRAQWHFLMSVIGEA